MIGPELGPYRILDKLGAGGMGEVYRARDRRLNRDVAIKVLPPSFLGSPERRARFEREAQVLASLNHPNIAQIYGVESSGPGEALVMELVEGQTLSARVKSGALACDEALEIARQIADALDAAHERGIVHRDLKPANVKVRDDGTVKVLDFGLAKALDSDSPADLANSPTISSPAPFDWHSGRPEQGRGALTEHGMILGTVGYMSPEQARGRPVDRRADIWAFGCVLYELVTGTPAFAGDTVTDVLAAVMSTEPDLARAPAGVRRLLRACLQKDPRRRLRDIGDAISLVEDPAAAGISTAPVSRASRAIWLALAAIAIVAGGVAVVALRHTPAGSPAMRFDLEMPNSLPPFWLSPDGKYLLRATQSPGAEAHLVLRSIGTGETQDVPATDGVSGAFWSPDSQSIGFISRGAVKTTSVAGGAPKVIAGQGANQRGCWAPDGFIVMDRLRGLSKVPAAGGELTPVTTVDLANLEIHHEQPACLPDGRFLYFRHRAELGTSGIYLGDPRLPPEKQSLTPVLVAADGPVFVPGSDAKRRDLLFMQNDTLFVQPFDLDRATLIGEPVRVVDPVGSSAGSGLFSASSTGVLVYATPPTISRQLTWVDRHGTVGAQVGPLIRTLRGLRLAPTGTRAAIGMFPPAQRVNNDDLWILPFDDRPPTRLTSDASGEGSPIWSPDATRIAFISDRGNGAGIYEMSAEGGAATRMASTRSLPSLSDWSRDGRFILFTMFGPGTGTDVWIVPVGRDQKPTAVLQKPFNESDAVFSPDGHWIAYLSNESGRGDVYVRRFEVSADGTPTSPDTGRVSISSGARGLVRWRRDGRELTYMSADGKLMSVEVTLTPTFALSTPQVLFTLPEPYLRANPTGQGFGDAAPDASRWLIALPPADAVRPTLRAIVNWHPQR